MDGSQAACSSVFKSQASDHGFNGERPPDAAHYFQHIISNTFFAHTYDRIVSMSLSGDYR